MMPFDLTHIEPGADCPEVDRKGQPIPAAIRKMIDAERAMSREDKMLRDIRTVYALLKAALPLAQRTWQERMAMSQAELERENKIFHALDFGLLHLGNWARE